MFEKILIANRGEIACRIARTARCMGIKTVAVYSEADAEALHVRVMDEAVPIGPSAARDSYLSIANIVNAAVQTKADALHPGYGFLSENSELPDALAEVGVTFIGPSASVIRMMGDKIEARKLARELDVSTIPGEGDALANAEDAVAAARAIGYPVMIKAAAGGGGKGMRIARDDDEAREGFRFAVNEAHSSFGDDRVFVEKLIEGPRHIEIQILADNHGTVVHLGERECSIQRRHQKVIEESPSPFLDDGVRAAMAEQAVTLARAVNYRSAGTVEFIVDSEKKFYFLEMNARLQVEHPVTEFVTGIDLVEQMIRVAADEPLGLSQKDIATHGWAIESRVYAEDPSREFLPATGRLVRYQLPHESTGVRVDSGFEAGDTIGINYDPLIAKLICHGVTRDDALEKMRNALDAYLIRGISHNLSFLTAAITHPRFVGGEFTTGFIEEEFPTGFNPADSIHEDISLLAALAGVVHSRVWRRSDEFACVAVTAGHRVPMIVRPLEAEKSGWSVMTPTRTYAFTGHWQVGLLLFKACVDGVELCVQVDREGDRWRLTQGGSSLVFAVLTPRAACLAQFMLARPLPDFSRLVLAPMPGLLVSLAVREGAEVKAGEEIAVIEAMKMENQIRAEREGTISVVHVALGDLLEVDQPIVEFE
jgi:propionyl-CoA carboxylase alpha chain